MKFINKLLHQDPESREGIIASASATGIAANILIAAVKVVVGLLTSSIAIVSEGMNNASDALTSVLTLVGTKLAGKHPDEKHPFGYGRIEYLTSLVIAILILVTGFEMLTSSIRAIFEPAELTISYVSVLIVAFSAVAKYLLGSYMIKQGKKADSGALIGIGLDSRGDSFASLITIVSAVIFLVFDFSVDAYAGIITSVIILKAGYEVLKDTVSELLGRPGEKDLADRLYREIRSTDGVINAADMMLHNYGPDSYSGSVNLELDHGMTVGEVYQFLHELQLRIMHEYNVTMVFGIYAVDNDHEESKQLRNDIAAFVRARENIKSYHAVYVEPGTGDIYCDFIVDYKLRDYEGLRNDFLKYMDGLYPNQTVRLTIETEFV